jgi:hypothetical protein
LRAVGALASVTFVAGAMVLTGAGPAFAHDGHGHGHHHDSDRHHHDYDNNGNDNGGVPPTLYVSPTGSSSNDDSSCDSAAFTTIQSAVDAANPGDRVIVCAGTYNENVVISTPISLHGEDAVIQGQPTSTQMCDQLGPSGPGSAPCLAGVTIKSSWVWISGFTVQGAIGEGILATGSLTGGTIDHVTITDNRIVGNNTGGIPPTATSPYPQCAAFGQVPGDCGEGIHLMGVSWSEVSDNFVSGNEGGVLLTDEFGPTHDNMVERNVITANPFDCGITVPGHNPNALDASGNRQPDVAGVYNNTIQYNIVTDNGLQGEGAGVLFANATAGTASYDNVVQYNYLAGNSLSGVTMHAHTLSPGQFEDLSGNDVEHNVIGTNNVGSPVTGPGDGLDGPPAQDFDTTGVLVFSASVPLQVDVSNNVIFNNTNGIWLGINGNVLATTNNNQFFGVTNPVFTFS